MPKSKKGKHVTVYPTVKERKQIEKNASEIGIGLNLSDYFRELHRRYQEQKNETKSSN